MRVWLAAGVTALTLAAGCGGGAGGEGGGDLIVGTTDDVVSLDPAKAYDYYSSNILFNAGDTLMGFEPGAEEVSPQLAAEEPEISGDGLTYTFTLRDGVTFHDGSELTSEDVKFSLERAVDIAHPEGAGFLLAEMKRIDAPDDRTVVIELSAPDITFASRLAYSVGTIVPSDGEYTAPDGGGGDPERFVNEELVASGPYEVTDFRENESITLEAFDDYWGDEPANDRVLVQFFEDGAQLQAALEAGEIDIAYRDLTPEQRLDLQGSDEVEVVEGDGATIRYIVLNPFLEPMDDLGTRRALAAAVDRQRIIDEVLAGGGEPLYSMVPTTFDAYVPAFEELYGQADPEDFVDGRVNLDLWYTPTHYGDTEASVAQTLQRTLEETGVFDVRLQSTEWAQYTEQAYPGSSGSYPAYLLGWYPDYLDPDDYLEPFYAEDAFVGVYDDPRMQRLLAEEQGASSVESPERLRTFAQMQQLTARDTPIVPLYQQTPYAFVSQGVQGVEETMDLSQIFRYYVISKTE